jgi:ubiquitin C-terminal hydrolase
MKKTNVTKKTSLWHCPSVLILHLKRFKTVQINNSYHNTRQEKINSFVKFPINGLDLNEYMSEYTSSEGVYDLYAVIHQSGSLGYGHYVTYTKNLVSNDWYCFNDESVDIVEPSDVENELVSKNAYVLFYKKKI